METATATGMDRARRIVDAMRAKTAELVAPVRRRLLEEEEQAKKSVSVLFSARPAYMVLAMRVPMRGSRYMNRGA